MRNRAMFLCCLWMCLLQSVLAETTEGDQREAEQLFQPLDVFKLEWASDPQISPDGSTIIYVRNFMDIMKDTSRASLWSINFDGSQHRPLTRGNHSVGQPRWSPDRKRLAYISDEDGTTQLYLRYMDIGQTTRLTQLTKTPANLSWSPDGNHLALSMMVPQKSEPLAKMPEAPEGAKWAAPPKVIERLTYRFDGRGYLKEGFSQIFVLSSEGGSPRQLTFDPYHHGGRLCWTPDSKAIIFSANRQEDWEHDPIESELFELTVSDGSLRKLTDRNGPDESPSISPDGRSIAYIGFDDQLLGYHTTRLYVLDRQTRQSRLITGNLDRSVDAPRFSPDGRGVYFQYDDKGNTKLGYVTLAGQRTTVASNVGGLSLGRPYSSGEFSVAKDGRLAFTQTDPKHPAEVASVRVGSNSKRLTRLNNDLLPYKTLGDIEEIWFESSFDQRQIHGWIIKPPKFDASKKYPLILEIHGGPFANYGDRFAAEMQLYAAAGYVVLYVNPRGSTSYGAEFANLIHHNYPGQDYDDLMSGVDAVIKKGYIDTKNLFVTGGSGGGVLTAWIIGQNDRFQAAVVAKPVINWYSFALTADAYNFFYRYWFPGPPWDHADQYLSRSPISKVGNVSTPTMLITGEADYRTPISETEQFYQALQLRKIESALVRIPEASHAISSRPSRLIAKAAHVLAWFERYRTGEKQE